MLQTPFFHFIAGSGKLIQNVPVGYSTILWQPSHWSTIGWQLPPLNSHPLLVIKMHSVPFFTVVQTMITTSFLYRFWTKTNRFSLLWTLKTNSSSELTKKESSIYSWVFLLSIKNAHKKCSANFCQMLIMLCNMSSLCFEIFYRFYRIISWASTSESICSALLGSHHLMHLFLCSYMEGNEKVEG